MQQSISAYHKSQDTAQRIEAMVCGIMLTVGLIAASVWAII